MPAGNRKLQPAPVLQRRYFRCHVPGDTDIARMTTELSDETRSSFHLLTPDLVIDLAEKALGERCTNICRPLSSYINRVFELQRESGEGVIAKFYRPGRWSRTALLDEHDFLFELEELEIPVIAPFRSKDGRSIHEHGGMYFTLFPKKLGRALDEPTYEQWESLGRLLARVHNVGATHPPRDRITMSPECSTRSNLEFILGRKIIPQEFRREYESAARDMIALIAPMFKGIEMIRIHGDCHQGNIINRLDETFYLIDFDDMAVGPPVQDFWMLLPDYSRNSLVEIDFFLEGYNTFRSFDRRMLKLIEPLRAMRYIHFTAWCAAQASDGGFARLAPGWGTPSYWREAVRDLREQIGEIRAGEDMFWGM
jgi:Ser/Thr protein kinase RdoA (MazF antagonist)